jgi:hypothetical protein
MSTNSLPPAIRLASLTAPLGGSATVPQPRAPLANSIANGGTASFPEVLLEHVTGGSSGFDPLSGPAGLPAGAGMPLGTLTAASPQLAKLLTAEGLTGSQAAPGAAVAVSARAVAWARSMLGRQDWNQLCQKFVEEAYGRTGIYPTAAAAAKDLVKYRGRDSLRHAPVGALLYFGADESNDFNGHAAIYLGAGRMISARPDGVREESVHSQANLERFLGWGPANFPASPRRATASHGSTPLATSLAPTMHGADQTRRTQVLAPPPVPHFRPSASPSGPAALPDTSRSREAPVSAGAGGATIDTHPASAASPNSAPMGSVRAARAVPSVLGSRAPLSPLAPTQAALRPLVPPSIERPSTPFPMDPASGPERAPRA